MSATQALLAAWRLNNRINLRLIDAISDAGMRSTLSTRGGRDVARQFVHLHNVRWAWLSMAGPAVAKAMRHVKKLDTKNVPKKAQLKAAHTASCEAILQWLAGALDEGLKRSGWPQAPRPFCSILGLPRSARGRPARGAARFPPVFGPSFSNWQAARFFE
jgi:uncharacterized damage-inducible protein DinB